MLLYLALQMYTQYLLHCLFRFAMSSWGPMCSTRRSKSHSSGTPNPNRSGYPQWISLMDIHQWISKNHETNSMCSNETRNPQRITNQETAKKTCPNLTKRAQTCANVCKLILFHDISWCRPCFVKWHFNCRAGALLWDNTKAGFKSADVFLKTSHDWFYSAMGPFSQNWEINKHSFRTLSYCENRVDASLADYV